MDLFESLDRAAKEDKTLSSELNVTDLFSSWSNQKGVPVLIVSRNYIRNSLEISQERYFNKYPHPEANLTSFWIPYNFDTAHNFAVNNTSPDGWLPATIKSMRIKPTPNKKWARRDWILFNRQQTGYYRVLYDLLNYKLIARELNSGNLNKIHPYNRAQLLDDTNDFVKTGRLPAGTLFDLTQYLSREKEYGPWSVAEKYLTEIKRSLDEDSEAYKIYTSFVANLVTPLYNQYSINRNAPESHVEKLTQQIAIRLACSFGVEECVQEAKKSFDTSMFRSAFESPNTRGLIYEFGMRDANSSVIDSVWNRFQSTTNRQERQEILESIGSIGDKLILQDNLYRTFDPYIAMSQEERTILFNSIVAKSKFGLAKAVELLNNQPDNGAKHLVLDAALSTLANNINLEDLKEQVRLNSAFIRLLMRTQMQITNDNFINYSLFQFQSILDNLTHKNLVTKQRSEHFAKTMETTIMSAPLKWQQFEETLMHMPPNEKIN